LNRGVDLKGRKFKKVFYESNAKPFRSLTDVPNNNVIFLIRVFFLRRMKENRFC